MGLMMNTARIEQRQSWLHQARIGEQYQGSRPISSWLCREPLSVVRLEINKKLWVEKCKTTGHDCADFRADLSVLISRIDLSDGFPILSRLCRKTSLIIPLSRHRRLGHQQLLVDAQHLPNFFSDPQKFDLLYCDLQWTQIQLCPQTVWPHLGFLRQGLTPGGHSRWSHMCVALLISLQHKSSFIFRFWGKSRTKRLPGDLSRNPLVRPLSLTLDLSDRSRCGAVPTLRSLAQPSRHFQHV